MNTASNIVPIRALPSADCTALAPIVSSFRAGDVADDLLDALRSHQAFARTCMLLQRRLDAAREHKRQLGKELGRAVKRAWEDFGKHFSAEEWRPVDEASAAAREGTATQEQLDLLVEWCAVTRQRFLGHDGAKLDKERALKTANGRIEDLEIALRRVILEQPGAQKEQAQQDLPGVKVTQAPGSSGVWDAKVRRTVVEVFAEEVRETRTKAAAPEVNADARAAAEAQAAADEALVSALKAMGIADDALPDDDLEDMDDEPAEEAEGEEPDPEQAELPIIDTTATEVSDSDDIAAAEKHEALQGAAKKPRGGRKAPTNRADGGGK